HGQIRNGPVFLCAERLLSLIEEGLERLLRGIGYLAGEALGQRDVLDAARLRAVAVRGFEQDLRDRRIARERKREFAAQIGHALLEQEALLVGVARLAQRVVEALALEAARGADESRVVHD